MLAFLQVSVDEKQLQDCVEKLLDFEYSLARNYSTSETIRRQYERQYVNGFKDNSGSIAFINFDNYFEGLSLNDASLSSLFNEKREFARITELEMIKKLSKNFDTTFKPEVVINYLFYRLLAEYQDFLPVASSVSQTVSHTDVELPRFGRSKNRRLPLPRDVSQQVTLQVQEQCAHETQNLMQYANARFYADYTYPDEAARSALNKSVSFIYFYVNTFQ